MKNAQCTLLNDSPASAPRTRSSATCDKCCWGLIDPIIDCINATVPGGFSSPLLKMTAIREH
jgi:hypothetical protein